MAKQLIVFGLIALSLCTAQLTVTLQEQDLFLAVGGQQFYQDTAVYFSPTVGQTTATSKTIFDTTAQSNYEITGTTATSPAPAASTYFSGLGSNSALNEGAAASTQQEDVAIAGQ
jgi:hypothetical protein